MVVNQSRILARSMQSGEDLHVASNPFFDHPILNSPYECPRRHWELDPDGQPTQQILETRRRAEFITPIPKPKKRKKAAQQNEMVFDEGKGLSTAAQQYDPTSIINEVRQNVDTWRALPNPSQWQVTPETARLLQHWRHHKFSGVRPFFCQVEAVETAIWLTEVAPQSKSGKRLLDHLASANKDANPELMRLALKLATGAGKTTVMAMLIAWQTINAVRRPSSKQLHPWLPGRRAGPDHQGPPARAAAQRPRQLLRQPRAGAQRHARRPRAGPRSSSPTTTPSSCASASSCPRAAASCCKAAPATHLRRWRPKARCSSASCPT